MVTTMQVYLDAIAAGPRGRDVAYETLPLIPASQVRIYFDDFAPVCPDFVAPSLERRPGNALNLEVGAPMRRCRQRTPESWGDADPGARRWLHSGGSPLVLGLCSGRSCPRTKSSGA